MTTSRLPVSIDHIVIASSSLEATDEFYARVFGATIERPRPDFHQYRIGDRMLNVHGPGLAEIAPPSLLARLPVQPGGSDLCFWWNGTLAALLEHLAECRVSITVGPVERSGARGTGTSVYFRDPDGSLLEYITYGAAV